MMPKRRIASSRRRAGCRGFTLIEALIASIILLMVVCTVLALASRAFKYMRDMRKFARSSQVLQQKMEDIRLINVWTNLWALNNTTFTDSSIAGEYVNGTVQITSYDPAYPTTVVACVTLTATWTNSVGITISNRLTSLICQNGLNKYIF